VNAPTAKDRSEPQSHARCEIQLRICTMREFRLRRYSAFHLSSDYSDDYLLKRQSDGCSIASKIRTT